MLLLLKPPCLYLLLLLCQLKCPLWELGKCTFFYFSKICVYQSLFFLDFNSAWYDLLFYSPYLRKILPIGQHLKLVLVFLWTPFNNCSFDRNTGSNLTAVGTYGELQTINWLSKNRWLSIIINLATTYDTGVINRLSQFRLIYRFSQG